MATLAASSDSAFWGLSALGWQALSTVVAAGAFIVALIVGYFQLRSARKTRLEQSRPYIVVDLVPGFASPKLIDMVITNIGATPAYDLRVKFDPPPERAREDVPEFKLRNARILNKPTPMMAPKREFRMFFDNSIDRYASDLPMSFTVTTTYQDSHRTRYTEVTTLDFDVHRGAMYTEVKSVHDGVKTLEKIAEALQ
jgi:hypothetical protein